MGATDKRQAFGDVGSDGKDGNNIPAFSQMWRQQVTEMKFRFCLTNKRSDGRCRCERFDGPLSLLFQPIRPMKKFELTSDMLTMSGTFYPKGYAFIMFPNAPQAERAALEIGNTSPPGDTTMFLNAATVLKEVGKVEGDSDVVLPSVGTEGATVRKYVDLARKGHCALMIKVSSDEEAEQVMQSARSASFSYGQRYHLLAMEDLE